jgi:hypothetical protein
MLFRFIAACNCQLLLSNGTFINKHHKQQPGLPARGQPVNMFGQAATKQPSLVLAFHTTCVKWPVAPEKPAERQQNAQHRSAPSLQGLSNDISIGKWYDAFMMSTAA